jgi:hypothetical protein
MEHPSTSSVGNLYENLWLLAIQIEHQEITDFVNYLIQEAVKIIFFWVRTFPCNRAKVPVDTAGPTQLFNLNPPSSTPQSATMPESHAETEARIEHQPHDCEKPNIAAMACKFQVPMTNCALNKTDVKRHHTSQNQPIAW